MLKFESYGDVVNGHRQDMAFVAEYAYPSYSAELKNWKEYLALSEAEAGKRDPVVESISLDYSKKHIALKTASYSVDLTSSLLAASDESALKTTAESWEQNRDGIAPYDGKPYDSEQYTFIDKIIYPKGVGYKTSSAADCLYILGG